MPIIVCNWSDKELDELFDLLKTADHSPIASFIFENFLASGNRIMDDNTGSPLRITVNVTDGRAVDLSPGVLQVNGYVSHVNSTQTINILATTVGAWGTGQAAHATLPRWSLICIKNTSRRITPDTRWFVDDSVEPNTFSQQLTNTEREMSYFSIQVVHGIPGDPIESITVPTGYWCIGEVYVPADPTYSNPVSLGNIYDTGMVSQDPVPHWTSTTRVQRLEFFSSLFGTDHHTTGLNFGHHKGPATPGGGWKIDGTAVTASADELNKLLGAGPTVYGATLTKLTDTSTLAVGELHSHATAVTGGNSVVVNGWHGVSAFWMVLPAGTWNVVAVAHGMNCEMYPCYVYIDGWLVGYTDNWGDQDGCDYPNIGGVLANVAGGRSIYIAAPGHWSVMNLWAMAVRV